jgi:hypothetical protein
LALVSQLRSLSLLQCSYQEDLHTRVQAALAGATHLTELKLNP